MDDILEKLTNISWWLEITIPILITLLIPWAYRLAKSALPSIFREKILGPLRKIYRRKRAKQLRKIKSLRFDTTSINREIAKNYCYLNLFWLVALIMFLAFLFMQNTEMQNHKAILWLTICSAPLYAFEFAWLRKSNLVDDLIKHRRKIKFKITR